MKEQYLFYCNLRDAVASDKKLTGAEQAALVGLLDRKKQEIKDNSISNSEKYFKFERIFQKLQRAHSKVSKLSVKLFQAPKSKKSEQRRKLRNARILVETLTLEMVRSRSTF